MSENKIIRLGNIMPTVTRENPNQGRVYRTDGIAPTLTCKIQPLVIVNGSIRKITPLECWRIMGFSDADFEKAQAKNSNTQLYAQAGNSIVKNVLVAVLGQMLPGKENIYKDGCGGGGKSQLLKTVAILAKTIIQTIRAYGAANRPIWAGKVEI